jgi:hypothetical protein
MAAACHGILDSFPPRLFMPVSRETALAYSLLIVVFISLLFIVGPDNYGDVYRYADDILTYNTGKFPPGQNPLWEFGHLLWRPFVWLLWKAGTPLLVSRWADSPTLQVIAVMSAIDIVAAAVVIFLIHTLVRGVCRYRWQALLVTLGFMFTNPFLNYMRSGTAYLPGLVFQLLGLLTLLKAVSLPAISYRRAMLGGALLAFSALIWFMYLMPIPGILFTVYAFRRKSLSWSDPEGARRLRLLVRAVLAGALIGVVAYGIGAVGRGVTSPADLRAWLTDAGHGISQDRTLARMVTSVPRAFFNLGNDGMILKRFVFKDPYAPVSVLDLLRLSVWKLCLVYAALLALVLQLWFSREKGLLIGLAIAAAPVLYFILVLFEPSGHERYFAVFAVLFLALACVVGGSVENPKRPLVAVLLLLLVALPPANTKSYIDFRHSDDMAMALQRILALRSVLTPNSVAVVLSFRDGISQFVERFPFHPAVRQLLPIHDVIEAGNLRTLHWRAEFAQRALATWQHGGEIWISRRLFAARPLPQWNWVEADDRRVKWTDLPEFFGQLGTDESVAGDDGFVRMARTESNRERLVLAAR